MIDPSTYMTDAAKRAMGKAMDRVREQTGAGRAEVPAAPAATEPPVTPGAGSPTRSRMGPS